MERSAAESAPGQQARERLLEMSRAYLLSRSIHAAAELGLADQVGTGPVALEELARRTGTRPALLQRVLRLLAAHGVFEEVSPGRFGPTPLSSTLREDSPASLRPVLRMVGAGWWAAVGDLVHTLRTGEPGFGHLHGTPFFSYLRDHPEEQDRFDAGMASNSLAGDEAIAGAYDFSRFASFVDLGGGRGGLARAILARHPSMKGTLFEQPQVLERAAAGAPERLALVAGDFFQSVPAGADAYLLKGVLHDFPDERCVEILRLCRRAMAPTSRLLLIERVVLPDNRPHQAKSIDVLMMALLGGRERAPEEWGALLQAAGLRLERQVPTPSEFTITEAAPAEGALS